MSGPEHQNPKKKGIFRYSKGSSSQILPGFNEWLINGWAWLCNINELYLHIHEAAKGAPFYMAARFMGQKHFLGGGKNPHLLPHLGNWGTANPCQQEKLSWFSIKKHEKMSFNNISSGRTIQIPFLLLLHVFPYKSHLAWTTLSNDLSVRDERRKWDQHLTPCSAAPGDSFCRFHSWKGAGESANRRPPAQIE